MNANVVNSTIGITTGAIALGGVKLILVGTCLAVGFAIGNTVVRKSVESYEGWKYSRLERKHRPPEEDHDNGGLRDDDASQEAGRKDL